MIGKLQGLGDRVLSRFVPEVVAKATTLRGVRCYCVWDSPGYVMYIKECSDQQPHICSPCYQWGSC